MKNTNLSEDRIRYIQNKMKVSRAYIIETCKLTRVSIERLADFIQGKELIKNRIPARS